jgi:tetratricopeptide (TPR) repeat protein
MKIKQAMIWSAFIVGAAQTLFVATVRAEAQDKHLEQAKKQMELGQEAFNKKSYGEAASFFERAFEASPFAAFLYNAGLAYERNGNGKQALEYYHRYLEMEPDAKDAKKITTKIETLTALTAVSSAESPSKPPENDVTSEGSPTEKTDAEVEMKSLISIRTNPKEAKIRILDSSGREVSSVEGPTAQTVERGTYIVEASHPDYRTVTTEITVASGQVYVVVVEMSQGAFLGFLKIITDIPGANVYIDTKDTGSAGATPFGNVVPVGPHRIFIEKPGYESIETKLEVGIGEEVELTQTLKRLPFGSIKVKTNVLNTEVFVDGVSKGKVDDKSTMTQYLKAGRHHVKVMLEDMKDFDTDIKVEGGKETKLLVRMNPKPSRTSGFVSAGFSFAIFGAGAAFGGIALHHKQELESDRNNGRLAADDPRIMEGLLWGIGADVSFGVGTIIAGMSLYYFLRDPLPPSEGKTSEAADFSENPKEPVNTDKPKTTAPPNANKAAKSETRPTWVLSPIIGQEEAGLGFGLAF